MTKWKLVPVEPTEDQWGGLAREIVMAWDMDCNTPRKLFDYLELACVEIPLWLRAEPEMQNLDHVPSKGTRAAIIYRAMLEEAPQPPKLSDCRIKELCDSIDFSRMVTADDLFYMIARAIEREILGGPRSAIDAARGRQTKATIAEVKGGQQG